jgi:hypothetical protein
MLRRDQAKPLSATRGKAGAIIEQLRIIRGHENAPVIDVSTQTPMV